MSSMPNSGHFRNDTDPKLKGIPIVSFEFDATKRNICRLVKLPNGKSVSSSIQLPLSKNIGIAEDAYDYSWLRLRKQPEENGSFLCAVDLFCGCGGMSLGLKEACRALGRRLKILLAADMDPASKHVYEANFKPKRFLETPIELSINGAIGSAPTDAEKVLMQSIGEPIDIVVGGPPCQGHSDLNNHTRRDDPRNDLYMRMLRFVELTKPTWVIIENVRAVTRSKQNVTQQATSILTTLNYQLTELVLHAETLGVAQRRRRHFLVGSLLNKPNPLGTYRYQGLLPHTVKWAIDDLKDISKDTLYDTSSVHSQENQRRLNYLFENNLYELPNSERPDCHRLKDHSYNSVYGRMRFDEPAPTITGGFGSIGQGRFGHPSKRRSITPHEAARLQFIPDYFVFTGIKRRVLQQLIGNAVPPKLIYVISFDLMTQSLIEISSKGRVTSP